MKFGEKIKELRTQKKMSQTELGKAVGVSLPHSPRMGSRRTLTQT